MGNTRYSYPQGLMRAPIESMSTLSLKDALNIIIPLITWISLIS